MANKNVVLKDESSNNIYPLTKIGNIVDESGNVVDLATQTEFDEFSGEIQESLEEMQESIDEIASSVVLSAASLNGDITSSEKYLIRSATNQGSQVIVNNIPFHNFSNILKFALTIKMQQRLANSPEKTLDINVVPGMNGGADVSICWPYYLGSNPAIYKITMQLSFESSGDNLYNLKVAISEIASYDPSHSASVQSSAEIVNLQILKYSLVYYNSL